MAEKNRKDNPQEQEQDLSQILQVRRDKLAALQKEGKDPFQQTKFTVSAHTQQIKDHFDQMEGQAVTVAGRLMSKRGMGKVSFCDLQDKTCRSFFCDKLAKITRSFLNRNCSERSFYYEKQYQSCFN